MSEWTLKFRPEGAGPPTEIRVRRLLKVALRAFGLRCVDVTERDENRDASKPEQREAGAT